MKYELVVFDWDGTLLDSRWQLPDANRDAICAAVDAGVEVAIVTGRMYASRAARSGADMPKEYVCVGGGCTTSTQPGPPFSWAWRSASTYCWRTAPVA